MSDYKLLYSGFDQFDIAFQGALSASSQKIIAEAKRQARKSQEPVLTEVGPGRVAMHVLEHGMRGGFAYVCDTGPTGE